MTKSTSGGCDQFETSPDAIEPELRTALCERRQTDRLKTNYSIDLAIRSLWLPACQVLIRYNFNLSSRTNGSDKR